MCFKADEMFRVSSTENTLENKIYPKLVDKID